MPSPPSKSSPQLGSVSKSPRLPTTSSLLKVHVTLDLNQAKLLYQAWQVQSKGTRLQICESAPTTTATKPVKASSSEELDNLNHAKQREREGVQVEDIQTTTSTINNNFNETLNRNLQVGYVSSMENPESCGEGKSTIEFSPLNSTSKPQLPLPLSAPSTTIQESQNPQKTEKITSLGLGNDDDNDNDEETNLENRLACAVVNASDNIQELLLTHEDLFLLENRLGVDRVRKILSLKKLKIISPTLTSEQPTLEKNEEHEIWMQQLRAKSEQKEYARMVSNVAAPGTVAGLQLPSVAPELTSEGASHRGMLRMSSIGLNMVLGMAFAYMGTDYVTKQWGFSPQGRLATQLGVMVFTFIVEMVLFIIRATKLDEVDRNRQKRAERYFNGMVGPGIGYRPPEYLAYLESLQKEESLKKDS